MKKFVIFLQAFDTLTQEAYSYVQGARNNLMGRGK